MRDASQRILGDGDKIKGALKELEVKIKQIPREALSIWKNYNLKVKEGKFLDNLRAQILEKTLNQIPLRTMRDASQRIIGNGDKIKGALRELEAKIKQIPRDALSIWKNYNLKVKEGMILDNLKAQNLSMTLSQIPMRVLKDSTQRILGNGDKIKGALRELEVKLKQIPRDALNNWKKYVTKVK